MYWLAFVGEGRSGHTIVSAVLGSHPHMRIAEEQKYIARWRREGWSRDQILKAALTSTIGKARKALKFDIDAICSHTEPLHVLGDKCGWDAVNEYTKRGASKSILTDFGSFMQMPVKTVVTLRHPLDNISAWVGSPKYERLFPGEQRRYRKMCQRYRKFYNAAQDIVEGQDTYLLHNERLIADPSIVLQELEAWLGLEPNRAWRRACAARVFKRPNQRRTALAWPKQYVNAMTEYINTQPLMAYYRGKVNG